MKKTTKKPDIRHHNQIIFRINTLIKHNAVRKNVGSVLVALASHANKQGLCFPSQDRLAAITEYKRETVNRLIKRLTDTGIISKSENRKPITKNGRTYYPRTIYKINIQMITRLVKSVLTKQAKNDHTAYAKNDHTNNSTSKDINTATEPKPQSKVLSINKIIHNAVAHEVVHTDKIKRESARKHGLKLWRIAKGLVKSTETIKAERKIGKANANVRDKFKPLLDKFTELQAQLMKWHQTASPSAFTASDHQELINVKAQLERASVRPPVNIVADFKLRDWISLTAK